MNFNYKNLFFSEHQIIDKEFEVQPNTQFPFPIHLNNKI
ncbi:MAG: hypothetical protein BAJALOKI1v1_870017 [Promethearchaeota archaeon]|nr:MAG: hypothetical protein BAJALOKI1v1_870017 [Candidatus Lokiarchaeota archaeon]